MLRLEKAKTQAQYDELLALIAHQSRTCLLPLLDWVEMVHADFGAYFRQTGSVYRVCRNGSLVGLIWVEMPGKTLFVHGIIVHPECQGQGIGKWALERIEQKFRRRVDRIGLEVHACNPRAKALYERLGYVAVAYNPLNGFYRMEKDLRVRNSVAQPQRLGAGISLR